MRLGRGPSVLASVTSVVAFDFFFIAPQLVVRGLRHRVPRHLRGDARRRSRHQRPGREHPHPRAHRRLPRAADGGAVRDEPGARRRGRSRRDAAHRGEAPRPGVRVAGGDPAARSRRPDPAPARRGTNVSLRGADLSVAQWVFDHKEPAGLGTDTLPGAQAHYLPLAGSQALVGVLAILPANPRRVFVPEQQRLLETFASQIALALERAQLGAAAKRSELSAESERLRNSLLAAISARSAHAARVDRRRLLEPARARRAHGRPGAGRARARDQRGGRPDVGPDRQRPRHGAPRVRCGEPEPPVASARGDRRGDAQAARSRARRAPGGERTSRRICRS